MQGTSLPSYLRDTGLLGLYEVECSGDIFAVKKNRKTVNGEETIDGMLILESLGAA